MIKLIFLFQSYVAIYYADAQFITGEAETLNAAPLSNYFRFPGYTTV